jgi:hypothetical protein
MMAFLAQHGYAGIRMEKIGIGRPARNYLGVANFAVHPESLEGMRLIPVESNRAMVHHTDEQATAQIVRHDLTGGAD